MITARIDSFRRIVARREWRAGIFNVRGVLVELSLSCGHTLKIAGTKAPKHRVHCPSCEGGTTTIHRRTDPRSRKSTRQGDRRSRK